jgi:hypothetical protein
MFFAQVIALALILRGAWSLRAHPALAISLLGTLAYTLWLPGPIAYERFRVPVMSLVATLIAATTMTPARRLDAPGIRDRISDKSLAPP